jgi:beta-lactam-binding protein with PASTA domain
MATERVTERSDGVTTERVVETTPTAGHTTVVERSGGSGAGLLIALAVIAFLALAAWFLMNANRNDAIQTDAVADAASSVAGSVDTAADAVAGAAENVAPPAAPAKQ